MNTNVKLFTVVTAFFGVLLLGPGFVPFVRADTDTNAPKSYVRAASSSVVTHKAVYSVRFLGGTASAFFNFLRTNGFASDTFVFAGKAADVSIPEFTLNNVRLREVATSLEVITEGQLKVEVLEQGVESDVNVWRIQFGEGATRVKTRACALPHLLANKTGEERVESIVSSVRDTLEMEIRNQGRNGDRLLSGHARTLAPEKIVVVVGTEMYVEGIALALEAAERVAALESSRLLRQ
ncbi:MAG TPA: hypothetical protein VMZ27_10135 [Candidatus Saccharimonadales bacterium]|nr:hypothetical protein [Candidatus Saccharimonadales bacterium]